MRPLALVKMIHVVRNILRRGEQIKAFIIELELTFTIAVYCILQQFLQPRERKL